MRITTEQKPAVETRSYAVENFRPATPKRCLPQFIAVAVQSHYPEVQTAVIGASLVPIGAGRRGGASQQEAAITGRHDRPEFVVTTAPEDPVPHIVSLPIQANDPTLAAGE